MNVCVLKTDMTFKHTSNILMNITDNAKKFDDDV